MTFRSDDDAREERVRSLEKQLEDARRELSVARPKVDRLEIAEKENRRLMAEISRSTAGRSPAALPSNALVRPVLVLVALAGLLGVGLAAAALVLRDAPERFDDRSADVDARQQEIALLEQNVAARADDVARREAELVVREAEVSRRDVPAPTAAPIPEPVIAPVPFVDHDVDFPAILRNGRVASVSGEAPVERRATCTVSISPADGECRAEVLCGGQSLYPRTGHGGYFHCAVTDHVLESGADVTTTDLSGDPRIELDVVHRRLTVSDGPTPEWSVVVGWDAS